MAAVNARSVVFDLFGDYIRYAGGSIGLSPLCELLEPFGMRPDAVRAVMTRLRGEGWFRSARAGRTVTYSLTPRALALLDEGRERIFARDTSPWDGQWHVAIYQVPEEQRKAREALRKRLTFLGYGPLAPSTWVSARDRSAHVAALAEDLTSQEPRLQVFQMTAGTGGLDNDRLLARQCWDLDEINDHYLAWLQEWKDELDAARVRRLSGPAALVTRVSLVRGFRRFPFSDPGLPAELLPDPWHGAAAHAAFMEAYEALEEEANAWFRAVVSKGGAA